MPKTLTWHTLKLGQIAYSLKNKESLLKKKKTPTILDNFRETF